MTMWKIELQYLPTKSAANKSRAQHLSLWHEETASDELPINIKPLKKPSNK